MNADDLRTALDRALLCVRATAEIEALLRADGTMVPVGIVARIVGAIVAGRVTGIEIKGEDMTVDEDFMRRVATAIAVACYGQPFSADDASDPISPDSPWMRAARAAIAACLPDETVVTPTHEWRVREPGVLELVGSDLTLKIDQESLEIKGYEDGKWKSDWTGSDWENWDSLARMKSMAEGRHEYLTALRVRAKGLRQAFGLEDAP